MELNAEIFQFLSRANIPNTSLNITKTYPLQRPDMLIEIQFSICDKPFEINFANVIGQRPSIGAIEYIDPYIDKFLSKRWPKCIMGKAKITCKDEDIIDNNNLANILRFLQLITWDQQNNPNCHKVFKEIEDQKASSKGYRREYFCGQLIDFLGKRIHNSNERYFSSEIGDFVGPGLIQILEIDPFKNINEFVWSTIIPFPNGTKGEVDAPMLKEKLESIRKHYNSYDELVEAKELHKQGNIKSSIRSAASSIDAILRYYCVVWEVKFPKGDLQFDSKIETILQKASKPSYRISDPENLIDLLYLYRARNSMHEGDCYYRTISNDVVFIKNQSQVEDFIKSAEKFAIWIDSLV